VSLQPLFDNATMLKWRQDAVEGDLPLAICRGRFFNAPRVSK